MKTLPLNNGKSTLVDDDVFEWAKERKWYESPSGYAICNMGHGSKERYSVALHTLVMGKSPKGIDTDHINQDTLDNRRENLRFVSRKVNCLNSSKKKWRIKHQGKWRVRFKVGGLHIGVSGLESEQAAKGIASLIKASLIYHELTKGAEGGQ